MTAINCSSAVPPDLDRLFRQCAPRLRAVVGSQVDASTQVVEDACQVAWARLATQRNVASEQALNWLTRTALREARRMARRSARDVSLNQLIDPDDAVWAPLPVADGPHETVAARLRVASLKRLSRRQRRLVWLQALGCSHEEIASLSGCSLRSVHRQLVRARAQLRAVDTI